MPATLRSQTFWPLLPLPLAFGSATSTRLRQVAAASGSEIDAVGGNPGNSYTIGVLCQPTTLTSGRAIYCRDNAGGGHTLSISGTAGAVQMRSTRAGDTSADTITSSTGIIRVNRWNWIFAVRDVTATTFLSIYAGGLTSRITKDSATGTNGSGVLDNDSGRLTTIGNDFNASPTVSFQGRIALVCRFARVLSLNEMQAIQFGYDEGIAALMPWCQEFVIPGERGAGVSVSNYGRDQSIRFTQTGTKPVGAGGLPVQPFAVTRRWRSGKAPALGGTTFFQSLTGAMTPGATLALRTAKPLAGTITPAATVAKETRRGLTGALSSIVGTLTKQTRKAPTGAVTPTGALASMKAALVALAGAITPAATLVRQTARALTGSATPAATLTRQTQKAPAGALAPTGDVTKRTARSLTSGITPAGLLTGAKVALQSVAGAITAIAGTLGTSFVAGGGAVVSAARRAGAVLWRRGRR